MIIHYLKVAIRNLLKYKAQNIISILGLSVGILCFSVCLYCNRYIHAIDQCFKYKERIADINMHNPDGRMWSGTPATLPERLRQMQIQEAETFTFMAYPRPRSYNVEIADGKELPYEELNTIEVDTNYYSVFTPEVRQGSWGVASQTPNAVILTRSLAQKIFGTRENPIGKRMILMQRLSTSPNTTPRTGGIVYTIQAVIEDIPLNTSLSFLRKIDMLTLNDSEGLLLSDRRDSMTGGSTFALLRPGKTTAQLEASFRAMDLKHTLYEEENVVSASDFGKIFLEKSVVPYFAGTTFIVGLLILLTGLLNFFQFLTGSYLNRSHEFGIRKVNGSNGKQLLGLLFTQSLVILLIAFLLTFCLIEILNPSLSFSLFDFTLTIEQGLLWMQTAEYMVGIVGLCLLLCLFTVWRVRHVSIQTNIYMNKSKRHKQRMRNVLLGIQFFICWLFFIFTVALYLQAEKTNATLFQTLTEKEKSEILSVSLDYRFLKNDERLALIERISQHSGVKDKLLTDINYLKGMSGSSMQTEKGDRNSSFEVNVMSIPANFFEFMKIPILSGHTLQTDKDMVADHKLVERMQKDLLGTTLYNYRSDYTVCGICADFIADTYYQSQGYVFLPCDFKDYVGHCYLKCMPGKAEEVKAFVKKTLEESLPESIQLEVSTLLEDIHKEQAIENNLKGIILFFSLVSLVITLLGVYSAITLDTERRQKEVAIRKVNGAGLKQIIILFARMYVCLLVFSAAVAFPLCYVLIQAWKGMYIVFFNDGPLFWISIFAAVTTITALTIIFRILKIARTNPAEVIKSE
ncbi:ABC transporter permease [uncultured Bacteroides sp.]|uniref:ABC transporter permease n=1 Tax=uncultured Bacteroides sp. TaxID=162156 RepID=UPI00260B856A|nr:ABC transporter permease [uncultured Bacteroides sp.]